MTKTQMLAEINEMVTNLIELHNRTNSMKAKSVQFLGVNKPSLTGTRGNVVEIDNNGQIMLEFEDYLGTTDYLPLAMFDNTIIGNVHNALSNMVNELIECVYIVIEEYNDDSQTITEIYPDVFRSKNDAQNKLVDESCIISRNELSSFVEVCKNVLKSNSPTYAKAYLPTQSGFFFGSTNYDEYYWQDVKDCIKQMSKLLKSLKEGDVVLIDFSW